MKTWALEVTVLPLVLALSGAAQAQSCETPASAVELAREVSAAEAAFVSMDADGFDRARAATEALLPCLDEPITAVDAAGVHRVRALAAFALGDQPATEDAWRAVLAVQPGWTLSERMAPAGTPLHDAFETAKSEPQDGSRALRPPKGTTLTVDGVRAEDRPTERPFVLQAQSRSGEVTHTDWFEGDARLPGWAELPVEPEPEPKAKSGKRPPVALLATAVGGAVVAGSAYGAAWAGRAKYKDQATAFEDLEGIKTRTNGAVLVAMGFSGLSLGAGMAVGVAW